MRRSANILTRQLRAMEPALVQPCRFARPPLPLQMMHRYSTEASAASTSASAAAEDVPPAATPAPDDAKAALEQTLAQRDSEIAQLKNALMTEMASFANLQKNTAREKAAAREYAISKFAEDLVANLDVLGMALQAVPVEKRTAEGTAEVTKEDLANLWTGVQMTMKELEATLKRAGVTPFESVGEKFDPNKHEALYQVDMPDKTPGTVFQCSQRGWNIKNRLLRPAQVGVVRERD